MRRNIRVVQSLLVSLLLAAVSMGQDVVRTARPDQAESVGFQPPAYAFVALGPCRQYNSVTSGGPITSGATVAIPLTGGNCAIPASAVAVSANFALFAITGATGNGVLKINPTGSPSFLQALINYPPTQGQIDNASIVRLGTSGSIDASPAQGGGSANLIIDVNGYYTSDLGSQNTFVGASAGSTTSGCCNTAIGNSALMSNTTGTSNTAIGHGALQNSNGTGSNIGIGYFAGINIMLGVGNIHIGNFGANENNTIRIGDSQTATFIAGINGAPVVGSTVFVNGSGQLGVGPPSSARFKEDIRDIGDASDGLLKLRPVSFRYKPEIDSSGLEQYGLVAEEVARFYPDLVTCDAAGQVQTVRYHLLVPMLLNEVQKERKTIEEQRDVVQDLKARLERLEALLSASAH